jgi:processive 1,2-diacylglycerol beta-glucosyltransferase
VGTSTPLRRHALLLPGSIGSGHQVLSEAVGEDLTGRGWTTETADVMALLGGSGQRVGERVFRGLLSTPGAFDALHFAALRQGSAVADWLDARAVGRIVPRLRPLLAAAEPALVVSVFATAASAVSRLKPELTGLRTLTVCSDFVPHRLWVHPGTDCYLVTSPPAASFVRRFDPAATVVVVPTPVRAAFYDAPPRAEARASLGLPATAPCVLLMSGGWGLGPLAASARALAASGVETLAVAGHNRRAERELQAVAATDRRVHAFGFTDRVAELMAAADVVVSTSGDTCSEARVVGRRLVLLDVVAGHGRENLQHELELGGAVVASTEPSLLTAVVRRELEQRADPPRDIGRRESWHNGMDEALRTVGLR